MKSDIIFAANQIWKKAESKSVKLKLDFEVELYKKLLNIFHVGDYYYGIFNYEKKDFDFVSTDVQNLLGYDPKYYNIPFLLNCVHPDDIAYLLDFENKAIDFLTSLTVDQLLKYKIRHDYRLRKSNGEYIRILQQGTVIQHDETGGIMRTLIVHTDITHLKQEGEPLLSFIGLDGQPSYINVIAKKVPIATQESLTKREKEILSHLISGKLSKEIADILQISKHTVDVHRKNMLHKNKLSNTNELVAKAIRKGWL